MNKLFFLIVSMVGISAMAQVSMRVDKPELLEKFKGTETIFILSDAYDTQTYETVLKQSWTVTPYRVIRLADFNAQEYLDDKHSFVMLDANKVVKKNSEYIHTFLSVFMFDMEKKEKEIEKMKKASDKKKADFDIMRENRIVFSTAMMYKNAEFLSIGTIQKAGESMYAKNMFHNYNPGLLKNYFQNINSLISQRTPQGLFGGRCTPELKALAKTTLLVPEYVGIKYKATTMEEMERDEKQKNEIFEDYKFKYEYIATDEIGKKIMEGEDFYYLRYVMENAQKYVQVVHSTDGNIVYSNYHPMSYNLKSDNLEEVAKAIEKGKV